MEMVSGKIHKFVEWVASGYLVGRAKLGRGALLLDCAAVWRIIGMGFKCYRRANKLGGRFVWGWVGVGG